MDKTIDYIAINKTDGTYLQRTDHHDLPCLYQGNLKLTDGDTVGSEQVFKVLQAEVNEEWVDIDDFNPFLSRSLPYRTRYIFRDKKETPLRSEIGPWIALNERIPKEMQECLFTKLDNPADERIPRTGQPPIIHGVHIKDGLFRPFRAKATHLFRPTHWMPAPDVPTMTT
ncbi:DUF551 domain-containing protein [Olivibacter sp. XZL3]|uniref:DUF551 domain-containing protein n=1 Tax=Olivibacter sp. XZL3 TaxID=1735116 RepID=UPI00106541F7|nr:DUF551 domain-containing protein [Olivibacter sp. XZL3]